MLKKINRKLRTNFSKISLLLLSIFLAFICGNIFGILSKLLNPFVLMVLTLLIFELINYFKFALKSKIKIENQSSKNLNQIPIFLNVIKRGFLIGIFVEAFKVGS